MLDIVFLAMFAVIPVMGWSILLARQKKKYELHKRVQIVLSVILLITVVAFEIDMRAYGWEERAAGEINGKASATVWYSLYVHLFFAISTALLWPWVIWKALRNFASPPVPNEYSRQHQFWARIAAADMLLTSVTGWVFYVLAFVL